MRQAAYRPILIDPFAQTVRFVQVPGGTAAEQVERIKALIGLQQNEYFEGWRYGSAGDIFYVDEYGRGKHSHGFILRSSGRDYFGKALLSGVGPEGEDVAPRTALPVLLADITWGVAG